MQGKITKSSVDKLEPWTVLWDTDVKGFGVRRHGATAKHYLLRYRFGGKQQADLPQDRPPRLALHT